MGRYLGDMTSTAFLIESGTYAVSSGANAWIGYVQDTTINEDAGVIPVRYQGSNDRDIDLWVDGPLDFKAKVTYFPTDWRMLVYALGSNVDTSGAAVSTHVITSTNSASGNAFTSGTKNPFMSLEIRESQKGPATGQNFIRTIQGAMVDSLDINMTQGEIITVDMGLVGQSGTWSSGAIVIPTNPNNSAYTKPFVWQDVAVHIPSGTIYSDITSTNISIKNNMDSPHYVNGSRVADVPIPLNRDYSVGLTLHGTSEQVGSLYNIYYLQGTEFNMMYSISPNTGSRYAYIVFSGCKVTDMKAPTKMDGINTQTLTIKPKVASASVGDLYPLYNPW